MTGEAGKLTTARLQALDAVSEGKVWNVRFGYGAWRIQGAHPTVVGALIRTLRLAEWAPFDGGDRQLCVLTPAGRTALSSREDGR